ncbi:hypothetical protein F4781DRAFT_436658 [Annulohypoxylon bovei var. microspora]|nr:hypothetical protein F4781DRAFT_436658 [Annulohypoxylon bovei var. microspora]
MVASLRYDRRSSGLWKKQSQAAHLAKHHPLIESWIKLFFGGACGLGFGSAFYGQGDNDAQSKMRREMFEKYHEEDIRKEMSDHIWEPICGAWFRSDSLHAAPVPFEIN